MTIGENYVQYAYAASVQVDCNPYNVIAISALTGNLTLNIPLNPMQGMRLVFIILQDGTGGRTVAFNAAFKHNWSDVGNTANKTSTISFVYNGTNWIQLGAQSPYV